MMALNPSRCGFGSPPQPPIWICFLIPYTEDDDIDVDFEILDILQPYVGKHDENLKWLDALINSEEDDS